MCRRGPRSGSGSSSIKVIVADLDMFIDDVMRKIALDLVEILASAPSAGGTPIDTGWASANWIPYLDKSTGTPFGSRPENSSHGQNNASRSAQQVGVATVAANFDHIRNRRIVVSNAVPYIIKLNDVPGGQAPKGFVQTAMVRVVRDVRKTLKTCTIA